MSDLRERLLAKQRPVSEHPVKITDTDVAERAVREAEQAHRFALLNVKDGDDPDKNAQVKRAKKAADKARDALNGCFAHIPLRAMEPADFEALKDAHTKPDDEDSPWGDLVWMRAVALECLPDDLTREEWEKWLDENCSDGEQRGLFMAAVEINARVPSPAVPKG